MPHVSAANTSTTGSVANPTTTVPAKPTQTATRQNPTRSPPDEARRATRTGPTPVPIPRAAWRSPKPKPPNTAPPSASACSASAIQPAPAASENGVLANTARRRTGRGHTTAQASATPRNNRGRGARGSRSGAMRGSRAKSIAEMAKVSASIESASTGPSTLSAPPAAMPNANTTLQDAESSAPASRSSSLLTTRGSAARSAGLTKATPAERTHSSTCSKPTAPIAAAATIPTVTRPSPRLAVHNSQRRSTRSATTPETGVSSAAGRWCPAKTIATSRGPPPCCSATMATATHPIQSPSCETMLPNHSRLKLRRVRRSSNAADMRLGVGPQRLSVDSGANRLECCHHSNREGPKPTPPRGSSPC